MRLENQSNNNSMMHKFQWPIYSVKRRQGLSYQDTETAKSTNSCVSGDKVRSILVQVGSMKIEDKEDRQPDEVIFFSES